MNVVSLLVCPTEFGRVFRAHSFPMGCINEVFEAWKAHPTPEHYEALGWEMTNYAHAVIAQSGAYRGNFEDLIQDAVVAGLEGIERFEGRSSFKTWFHTIVVRSVGNTRDARVKKNNQQQRTDVGECPEMVERAPDPQQLMEAREVLTTLEENLEKQDLAILNLVLQGYRRAEIGAVLNLSPAQVKYRMVVIRGVLSDRRRDAKMQASEGNRMLLLPGKTADDGGDGGSSGEETSAPAVEGAGNLDEADK